MTLFKRKRKESSSEDTAPQNQHILYAQNNLDVIVHRLERVAHEAGQKADEDALSCQITEAENLINQEAGIILYQLEEQRIIQQARRDDIAEDLGMLNDSDDRSALKQEQAALQKAEIDQKTTNQELELQEIRRKKHFYKNELGEVQSRMAEEEKQNGSTKVKGKVGKNAGLAATGGIVTVEAITAAPALANFGDGTEIGAAIVMAVGISLFLGATSHQGGKALSQGQKITAWAWMLIGGIVVMAINALRFSSGQASMIENLIFSALLIALYAASWLLAYHYWKAWGAAFYQNEADRISGQLEALTQAEDNLLRDISNIKSARDTEIEKHLHEQKYALIEEDRRLKLGILKTDHDRQTVEASATHAKKSAKDSLHKYFEQGRRLAKNSVYIFSMLCLLLFSSCDSEKVSTSEAHTFSITQIVDISHSAAQDSVNGVEEAYQHLMKATGLAKNEGWHGTSGEIRIIVMGDLPEGENIRKISLSAPPVLALRNPKRRKKQLLAFQTELREGLAIALSMRGSDEKTHLNSCLTGELNRLAATKAKNKSLMILSDMVHDCYKVSFHRYKNNPRGLIEDAEQLNAKLDRTGKLDTLDTIAVTIAYAGEKNKALYLAASEFWKGRICDNNDSVSVTIARTLY